MEVISEKEAEIVLKYLVAGLAPEKVSLEIIGQRKFYSPAGVRRDVERIRIKFEDAKRNVGEMF